MTINELIERAHSQAKSMGWWDEERNTGELLMLIVSECGEALEAHRSGKFADLIAFDREMQDRSPMGLGSYRRDEPDFAKAFKLCVKDTFSDELADIVIRIADLLGDIGYVCEHEPNDMKRDGNVGEALLYVTKMVSEGKPRLLYGGMLEVFGIAKAHNIDLWRHIDLKLKYNLTRGSKHGKSY